MLQHSVVVKLAFDLIKEIELKVSSENKLPDDVLLKLHSLFGEVFIAASELLENCIIIEYRIQDGSRKIFKIGTSSERFTVYNNINFCQCKLFKTQVLDGQSLITCKHILALKFNQILNVCVVKSEVVRDSQIVEFLNEQISCVEE